MQAKFTIRIATLEDARTIRDLGINTFQDTFGKSNTPEDMKLYLDKSFSAEQVESELSEILTTFVLAYDGEQVVGYAKLRASDTIPEGLNSTNAIEIERIYSAKEYIGKQVGKALIEWCLSYAKLNGFDTVWLGVWEHNPRAIAFYQKWGFEQFGSHPFLLGTDLQTDLLMKKNLTPTT